MRSRPPASYVPGASPIHRCPAGWKVLVLMTYLLCTSVAITSVAGAGCLCLISLTAYAIARIPWRIALTNLGLPLPVLGAFAIVMWWTSSLSDAVSTVANIYAAVALALLLTLTTRVSDMLETLNVALRPLRRCGFPAELVTLALALTMRLIPVQLSTIQEVLDARKARGGGPSLLAFGVPVIVRTILRAHALGEALISRGADEGFSCDHEPTGGFPSPDSGGDAERLA